MRRPGKTSGGEPSAKYLTTCLPLELEGEISWPPVTITKFSNCIEQEYLKKEKMLEIYQCCFNILHLRYWIQYPSIWTFKKEHISTGIVQPGGAQLLPQPSAQVDTARPHPADVVSPGRCRRRHPAPALLPGAARRGAFN